MLTSPSIFSRRIFAGLLLCAGFIFSGWTFSSVNFVPPMPSKAEISSALILRVPGRVPRNRNAGISRLEELLLIQRAVSKSV
ncbi:MAG TPA: hypothetical protein PKI45_06415 [Candidatus Omnitrophota bacterium]|nr:hypothetical protein [Candidatus Omnitrophota bacterium]